MDHFDKTSLKHYVSSKETICNCVTHKRTVLTLFLLTCLNIFILDTSGPESVSTEVVRFVICLFAFYLKKMRPLKCSEHFSKRYRKLTEFTIIMIIPAPPPS